MGITYSTGQILVFDPTIRPKNLQNLCCLAVNPWENAYLVEFCFFLKRTHWPSQGSHEAGKNPSVPCR